MNINQMAFWQKVLIYPFIAVFAVFWAVWWPFGKLWELVKGDPWEKDDGD